MDAFLIKSKSCLKIEMFEKKNNVDRKCLKTRITFAYYNYFLLIKTKELDITMQKEYTLHHIVVNINKKLCKY